MTASAHARSSLRLEQPSGLVAAGALWLGLTLFVAWRCRFWINSDTIGTLDAARSLRAFELGSALNGYFGTGFALLLAPLDLRDPQSFLGVHLVTTSLLIGSQGLLYASLRGLDVRRGLAAALCTVWATTSYASGSAVFITADVALCFWTSLYVWIATRHVCFERRPTTGPVAALGLIHAVAGVTKAIAFPAFLFLPAGYVAGTLLGFGRTAGSGAERWHRAVRFVGAYLIPLLLVGGAWALACQATYGRITLGGTGTYNYARFTQGSESLAKATLQARRELLPEWSYWWSDPNLSLDGWDRAIHIDPADPLRRIGENTWHYLSGGEDLARSVVLLALLGFSGLAFALPTLRGSPHPASGLLAGTGFICVGLYLVITVYPRHLTYPALLCTPLAGIALERLLAGGGRARAGAKLGLALALAHGVGAMLYASIVLAPDDTLFRIADRIEAVEPGPVGAILDPGRGIRSHGTVAFLAGRGSAEVAPVEEGETRFNASFSPKAVLWVRRSTGDAPAAITVNGEAFRRTEEGGWRTRGDKSIELYLSKPPGHLQPASERPARPGSA